jgi:hypothetical protein
MWRASATVGMLVGATILGLLLLAAVQTHLGLGPGLAISLLGSASGALVWWALKPMR